MNEDVNREKLKRLIESVVVEVLLEQDIVADDPLVKAFVEPFMDVIKTANAEVKKNLTRLRGNVKSLAKQAAILAIPFLSNEMIKDTHENAKKEIQARLGKIDQQYADVYQRNWDTLRSRDVWGITFMLNPAMGITSKFALKAPLATLNVLETLTAGGLSPENEERLAKAKAFATKLAKPVTPGVYSGGGGDYGGGGGYGDFGDYDFGGFGDDGGGFGEAKNPLREQQAQPQQANKQAQLKQLAAFVEAFRQQPDVQQAMQGSRMAQELRQGALEAILAAAAPVLKAGSYDQLASAIGPDMKKYEAEQKKQMPADLSPEEEKQFKEALVPEIKNAYKQVLITQLAKQRTGDKVADKNLAQLIAQIKKA